MERIKATEADHSELDAKQRIIEAATYLFGMKGYDGTSTREIAARAGVNIASLNYYFRSKKNLLLEVMDFVINSFKAKITSIGLDDKFNTASFAVKIFETLSDDGAKILNQFKLVMDMEHFPEDRMDESPVGYEQLSYYLKKELNPNVPHSEKLWACMVISGYIYHIALMSACDMGKRFLSKYAKVNPETTIKKLVNAVIHDLNARYP